MRPFCLAAIALFACAPTTSAQQAELSRVAVDTVVAIDEAVAEDGSFSTGVILDAVFSVDLGGGFEALTRPFVQRLNSGEWNRQIWVAAVRYQRAGPVGIRLDAGLIPSPVGLANMTLRPHQIPTISQPASLFLPLPPLELPSPRANVLGVMYPYGASLTLSGRHWDARAAVIDTSPLRTRRTFGRANPPRFANVVIGGGLTPIVGARIGASVTHGGWQRAGETAAVTEDRAATIVTVEAEYSVRYTKLTAEWVRDRLETGVGMQSASGWYVQGQQTLSARWFVGARVEQIAGPAAVLRGDPLAPSIVITEQRFSGTEETVGYRVTPSVTLRAGHRARRPFGRAAFDHQAAVSIVWWQRWR